MMGGSIKGGQIHGSYLPSFKPGASHTLGTNALRALPSTPWEAMWRPIAQASPHVPCALVLLTSRLSHSRTAEAARRVGVGDAVA